MKYLGILYLIIAVIVSGCSSRITPEGKIDELPSIYPDYIDVTIPSNIAPLNFSINSDGEYRVALSNGDKTHWIKASKSEIDIPQKLWRSLIDNPGADSIQVTVCQLIDGRWMEYKPFSIHISRDAIDPTLVYRLIPPLYGTWREMGIYERNLETFDERPIYQNINYHGNCVNCHSFCNRDPDRMLLHMRTQGGGTYLMDGCSRYRLDTSTDSTISNFTYPYWHPSGKYVAFSVNDIFQVFHTSDANRTEVIDNASDIIVYDISNLQAFSSPLLKSSSRLETFPSFSADGTRLYFCSAPAPDSLPQQYRDVHYSLCSIPFDPASQSFGTTVDTLYNAADTATMAMPRPSPDGKWLVATHGRYGNFMIWHKEADLWLYNTANGEWTPMEAANSGDVESYHSWSTNSRWLAYSSRRDDGLYTRIYIVHIDDAGNVSKPFVLPQRRPRKYYQDQKESYNIPELVDGTVKLDTRTMMDWIDAPAQTVSYK